MALHITDPLLDNLAEQAQKILKAPSKTDAIRQALERVVSNDPDAPATPSEMPPEISLEERLKALQERVRTLGTPNPDFDDKAFLDEMWEP